MVGLGRGHRGRIRVTINFARAKEEKTLEIFLFAPKLKQVAQAGHGAVDGLERVFFIVNGRGKTGGMNNKMHILTHRHGVVDVRPYLKHVAAPAKVEVRVRLTGNEVVDRDYSTGDLKSGVIKVAQRPY